MAGVIANLAAFWEKVFFPGRRFLRGPFFSGGVPRTLALSVGMLAVIAASAGIGLALYAYFLIAWKGKVVESG